MKIAVDGFGGDNAPLAVLQGCALAVKEYKVSIAVTGDVETMKRIAAKNQLDLNGLELVQADGVIDVEDDPTEIVKSKSNSSMAAAFKMVASGEADAFVSAGSTAAIVVGASLIVKRIKGVKRAALAPIIPTVNGCYMLLDGGANLDCRPEMLLHFGLMGSAYMSRIMGIETPRVGLANIGAEETKGGELQLRAYELLKKAPVNFTGNIEARDIPLGGCDVVVADGFTGNIILKLTEGMGKLIGAKLKDIFMSGVLSKAAALLVMKKVKALKKSMDYTEYGGAPLMGVRRPVIKAHGSSDAAAFKNAVRQAILFTEKDVIGEIEGHLAACETSEEK